MSVHSAHEPVVTHGLADDCSRCEEQAARPFEALDEENLTNLVSRTRRWMHDDEHSVARSRNEHRAMLVVEHALTCAEIVGRLDAKAEAA